jgi:hypothetical protein
MMKSIKLVILSVLVAVAACLMMTTSASAAVSCHQINAKGVGQDLGGGVTRASIQGGGLLQGTTEGNFSMSPTAKPTVFNIGGTVKFTTRQGTLTVSVTGTFDVATGGFTASGPVTASSGKLAGATGNLTLSGTENLTNGAFTETVRGNICVDLAP